MTKTQKDLEIGERLRQLIQSRFGDRGKFRLLQEASGIPDWKWKNFFYRRQEAGQDQLSFWIETYPDDEPWLFTGLHSQDLAEFPFCVEPPVARDNSTIADRLNWVIEEMASPRGEALFTYLAGRYKGTVSEEDWRNMILRKTEPTLAMVASICSDRPMFTEWVLLGYTSAMSVDPTSKESVQRWKDRRQSEMAALTNNPFKGTGESA